MHSIKQRLLAICMGALAATSCSSSDEESLDSEAAPSDSRMTFGWKAPARINVVESFSIEQRQMTIKYDVTLSPYGPDGKQLLVTTSKVTPIEFDGEQVNTSIYPSHIRQNIRNFLVDYHSRPQLVVDAQGQILSVEGVEDSILTIADINGVEDKEKFLALTLENPLLITRIESLAINVWDCWISNWREFEAPLGETVEQDISMVVFSGSPAVPGTRTLINHGLSGDTDTSVFLEQRSMTQGTPLAQAMIEFVIENENQIKGFELPVPNVDGVVTASSLVKQEIKLDPKTMEPTWAQCSRAFSVDSKDQNVLPSRSDLKENEYRFQWFK